jgi:hypothetical protein
LTIIQLLDALWTRCHEQRVYRAEEARKWVAFGSTSHRRWTPWAEGLIKARDQATKQQNIVAIVSRYIDRTKGVCTIEARVSGPDFFEPRGKHTVEPPDWNKNRPDWQKVHIVKVHEQTCTCGLYQEYLIPCCHGLAALYHCGISLKDEVFKLVPPWFSPISLLTAYDYIETSQNEWGDEITVHTGLRAIDVTRLHEYAQPEWDPEDPFADTTTLTAPEVQKLPGRRRTKRREAGDGKGPLVKPRKQQTCSVCSETGHNKLTCKRLQTLEGDTLGLGVL